MAATSRKELRVLISSLVLIILICPMTPSYSHSFQNEPSGLNQFRWGMSPSKIKHIKKDGPVYEGSIIIQYSFTGAGYTVSGVKVEQLCFFFIKNKLDHLSFSVRSKRDWQALRDDFFNK